MCRALGVNRTSFHDWERRAPSDRALSDAWLTEKIKQIHADSDGTYGARRIHAELRLRARDPRRAKARRAADERGRYLRACAAQASADHRPAARRQRVPPDLVERDFRPDARTRRGRRTSPTSRPGKGSCISRTSQDLFSRLIVGWSMADHLRSELVVVALEMALPDVAPTAA